MIPSPALADIQRWNDPTMALISGTAIMPPPRSVCLPMSSSGMALSMSSRISSAGTTDNTEITKIVARTPASSH